MSKINQTPSGLQKLLGSQSFGDNPDDLSQQVSPTVELREFYMAQRMKFDRDVNSLLGRGIVSSVTVPEGEIWLIHTVAAKLNGVTTAATDYAISIRLDQLPNMQSGIGLSMPIARNQFTSFAIGDILTAQKSFDGNYLILLGGSRVSAWFDVNGAGTNSLEINVWYAKL